MTEAWYLILGAEPRGPYAAAEVRTLVAAGAADADTFAWRTGLAAWTRLRDTELRALLPLANLVPGPSPAEATAEAHEADEQAGGALRPLRAMWASFRLCVTRDIFRFDGRASRTEFWGFFVFYLAVFAAFWGLAGPMVMPALAVAPDAMLAPLAFFVTLVPAAAVTVRRLHDSGLPGWVALVYFFPLPLMLGLVILLALLARRSEPKANRWGPVPDGVRAQ